MTQTPVWKGIFDNWPAGIQHRGVLITTLNEAIPFKGFMIKEGMLLLDRTNPDSMGARFILIDFAAIACIKLIDPIKDSVFLAAGFVGKLANQ